MRYVILILGAVAMLVSVASLLVIQTQVERVDILTEQNGLLRQYIAVQDQLSSDLEAGVQSCAGTMGQVVTWLGVNHQEAVGGPVSRARVP